MIRRHAAWLVLLASSIAACTHLPRPGELDEVDRTRNSTAAKEAAALSPQASLSADKLANDAEKAYEEGDLAGSKILAEHALGAYAHASVLARLAQADKRLSAATAQVEHAEAAFKTLEDQQRQILAEATDEEARVRVARDAMPLTPSEPSTPERERARRAAARALAAEARLLCIATQMVAPDSPGIASAFKELDSLDAALAEAPPHPAIDTAVRLRSQCLAELSRARRPASAIAPAAGSADALLDELSKAGVEPQRDDRGVVVTLRGAFRGAALSDAARDRLTVLGRVAGSFAAFPILVVTHSAKGPATAREKEHADTVAKALGASGALRVQSTATGDALPVAEPRARDSQSRNERVEVVFVAPVT